MVVVVEVILVVTVIAGVLVTVGLKDLVGAGGVIDKLVGVLAVDVLINVVYAVEITLGFAVSVSYSVDVLCDGAVDLSMNTFVSVLTVVLIGGLPGVDVDVLVDVNANVFAGVTTVKFVMPAPLEGLSF